MPTPAAELPQVSCGMDVHRLLYDELARRPLAGPDDLYLLVREAISGGGVASEDATLAQALAAAIPDGREPIVEDLDESSGTVRLNLRAFRFVGGTWEELRPIVQRSRAGIRADPARLRSCLAAAARVAGNGLGTVVEEQGGHGFPAVPHGGAYQSAYRPAYVVVLRRELPPWVTAPPPDAG